MSTPTTRDEVVEALWAVRERLCEYAGRPQHSCDCKYGLPDKPHSALKVHSADELSGCPEVLTAISWLKALTPAEADRLRIRLSRMRKRQ